MYILDNILWCSYFKKQSISILIKVSLATLFRQHYLTLSPSLLHMQGVKIRIASLLWLWPSAAQLDVDNSTGNHMTYKDLWIITVTNPGRSDKGERLFLFHPKDPNLQGTQADSPWLFSLHGPGWASWTIAQGSEAVPSVIQLRSPCSADQLP